MPWAELDHVSSDFTMQHSGPCDLKLFKTLDIICWIYGLKMQGPLYYMSVACWYKKQIYIDTDCHQLVLG